METQRVERKCNVNQTKNTVLEQNETKKTAKKILETFENEETKRNES